MIHRIVHENTTQSIHERIGALRQLQDGLQTRDYGAFLAGSPIAHGLDQDTKAGAKGQGTQELDSDKRHLLYRVNHCFPSQSLLDYMR